MHKRKEFKEEETQTVADSIPRTQQPAKSSAGYFFESALDRFLLLVNCHRLQPKPQLVLNRNPQATMTWTFRKRGPINLHATKLADQSYGESTIRQSFIMLPSRYRDEGVYKKTFQTEGNIRGPQEHRDRSTQRGYRSWEGKGWCLPLPRAPWS